MGHKIESSDMNRSSSRPTTDWKEFIPTQHKSVPQCTFLRKEQFPGSVVCFKTAISPESQF